MSDPLRAFVDALDAGDDDPSAIVAHYAQEGLEKIGVETILFRP